jgi:hypothetical protein
MLCALPQCSLPQLSPSRWSPAVNVAASLLLRFTLARSAVPPVVAKVCTAAPAATAHACAHSAMPSPSLLAFSAVVTASCQAGQQHHAAEQLADRQAEASCRAE